MTRVSQVARRYGDGCAPVRRGKAIVAIVGTFAVVVCAAAGCSKSSTPGDSSAGGTSSTPGAYTMILNGQTIAQGNDAVCSINRTDAGISYGAGKEDHSGRVTFTDLDSTPKLGNVSLTVFDPNAQRPDNSPGGFSETWEYADSHNGTTGPAAVTVTGKSFKATGKLSWRDDGNKTEPFEFVVTCPA